VARFDAIPSVRAPRRRAAAVTALILAGSVAATGTPAPAAAQDAPTSGLPAFVYADGNYASFEPPGAGVELYPSGVNDQGDVTGEYIRIDGESAFVRNAAGEITTFDVPGAQGTEAAKINDRGQVVGRYSEDTPFVDDSTRVRGFLRFGDRVTRLDVPDATDTMPTGINDRGQVVGYYVDEQRRTHGFVWYKGQFQTIDIRGATAPTPVDINDEGEIVGLYFDMQGGMHGFLLRDGEITEIAAPDAVTTVPTGINDRGQVVGYTAADVSLTGATGFLLADGVDGAFTPVAYPDAPRTVALGVNDAGQIVGLHGIPEAGTTDPAGGSGMSGGTDDGSADDAATSGTGGESGGDGAVGSTPWVDPVTGDQLVTVRDITVHAEIAEQIDALLAAAEADGLSLTGSGYRDRARQIALRRANCGTSQYAIYEMPSSACSPPTARPGMSMHERGMAIDFSCDGELIRSRSNECYRWMAVNASTYGLYNLPSEAWHWSTNGS
jgi:probable HAF family extracellular repeat protein